MTTESPKPLRSRKPGRPLGFDRDAALRQAMLQFWAHGYEATSISDLTSAMGITPPSLYTAFGDKKRLFLEAIQIYLSGPITSESLIATAPTARDAASALLHNSAIAFTGRDTPRGCLLASSAISCSAAAADVQQALAAIRRSIELRLRNKINRSIKSGDLPRSTDAIALAAHTMAVIQGMSTLARDGASREKLLAIANTAVRLFTS
jgi:AcrR family transcriptional regulator